jgi:hypoxanthine phosphoribosyltransferase
VAKDIESFYGEYDGNPSSVPLFVEVKFGGFIVYSMLLTAFNVCFPTYVGAIKAKSYKKDGVRSEVEISHPMFDCEVFGRKVLIIDDIVESGQTLSALKNWFMQRGASDVRTFALLDKPTKREFCIEVDWVGFKLQPNQWVVGLGLDDNNLFRHFPNIVVLGEPKPSMEKKKAR